MLVGVKELSMLWRRVEESGEFMRKAELSCEGRSEESKMGSKTEGKTPFKYIWVEHGENGLACCMC